MTEEPRDANPFVGLRPFDAGDVKLFFGRRKQTTDLLQSLHQTHFLAVVGSSGCGKSSLIRAGLIPALLGGFLVEDRDRWRFAKMKPGDGPIHALAEALVDAAGTSPNGAVEDLERRITEQHTRAVVEHIESVVGEDANLLVLLDQFEEVFAFRGSDDEEEDGELTEEQRAERARRRNEAAQFADLVVDLGQRIDMPVYTVLTMRTDFLGDCDLFYGLPEAMNRGRYLVPRLDRQQLREAICGPALLRGAQLAPRLVDRILNALGDRTDRLPVLQHALSRTWAVWHEAGAEGEIDLEHYDEAGGLDEALSKDANRAMVAAEERATSRIFRCLTATDANRRRVRRAASMQELMDVSGLPRAGVQAIVDRFNAEGRSFLVDNGAVDPERQRIDISHESLIRQWESLREWVDAERDSRDKFKELVRLGRAERADEASLLRDPELGLYAEWCADEVPTRAWAERYSRADDDFDVAMEFLDRSVEDARYRREKQIARRRFLIGLTAVIVAVLTALTIWALDSRAKAEQARVEQRGTLNELRVANADRELKSDSALAGLILLELDEPSDGGLIRKAESILRMVLKRGLIAELPHEKAVAAAVFDPHREHVATAGWDGRVRLWRAKGPRPGSAVGAGFGHAAAVLSVAFTSNGEHVVTGCEDKSVRVWRVADGEQDTVEPVQTLERGGAVFAVACHPSDEHVLVLACGDGTAAVWNWQTDVVHELKGHTGPVMAASFDAEGKRVATASADRTAGIWNATTGENILPDGGRIGGGLVHPGAVVDARFSPDGKSLATASLGQVAIVWNAASGTELRRLSHRDGVTSVAFSRDGKLVVTASWDKTARLWRGEAALEPGLQHGEPVRAAAFYPDGSLVITASEDATARIWDVETRSSVLQLTGHRGAVTGVAVSHDGKLVLTWSDDGNARLWKPDLTTPLPEKDLVSLRSLLRDRVKRTLTENERLRLLGTRAAGAK